MENTTNTSQSLSIGHWMLVLFLTFIPLLNVIMLLVWAFGSETPTVKANWAKAMLLWMVIGIALYAILFLIFGAALISGYGDLVG